MLSITDFLLAICGTFWGLLLSMIVEVKKAEPQEKKEEGTSESKNKKRRKHKISLPVVIVVTVILTIALVISYCIERNERIETQELSLTAMLSICQEHFKNKDYGSALDTLLTNGVEDAKSRMVFAYFMANGYGTEKNIPLSIKYYTAAMEMGEPRAETNMVISVAKNCFTNQKIEIIKEAYFSGNETAIQYVEYMVNYWNSTPENHNNQISATEIWALEDDDILSILNGEFYEWKISNKTYTTSVSVVSSEDFSRRFLYQIGDSRVYEESQLIVRDTFPSWLQEDVW